MTGYGRAPGTCGELIQGKLNGINFHVTCPVNFFSRVNVQTTNEPTTVIKPSSKLKTEMAIRETLNFFDVHRCGFVAEVTSDIPAGKGMASSTADITAACLAVADALGRKISSKAISKIALSIEPSDGIFLDGIAMFDHREGKIAKSLGNGVEMDVVVVDDGNCVDTLEFNKHEREYSRDEQIKLERAVLLIEEGFRAKDPCLIGEAAVVSSLTNQKLLFKPRLEEFIEVSEKLGCYGINIAHSGNVYGFLCRKDKGIEIKNFLRKYLGHGYNLYLTQLVSGGIEQSAKTFQVN